MSFKSDALSMHSVQVSKSLSLPADAPKTGRIYTFAGRNFYSPNCVRDNVQLPVAVTDHDVPKNIFLPNMQFNPARNNEPRTIYYNFSQVFIEDFKFPRWWTERWGWTAFVIKMPDFRHADGILYPLGERIILQHKQGRWRLSDALLRRISTLENEIITAAHRLAALAGATIIYPPPPRAFGYQKWYKSPEDITTCVERARGWFSLWLGLLSYLVAVSETKEQSLHTYPNLRITAWTIHLRDNGFHPAWIDDLLSSPVCSFDLHTPRAGIFIKFRPGQSNQPSLDWYCKYGIPVWYELTKDSPAVPDKFSPGLNAPSTMVFSKYTGSGKAPVLARENGTNLFSNLPASHSLVDPQSHDRSNLDTESADAQESASSRTLVDANTEWRAFFSARDAQNASIIAKEDQLQRQKRLAREKTPATKSAKIFEWVEDNDGVYRRQAVLGKYKQDTFEGYTKNQTRYDPVQNEWDCCVAFAPNEDIYDDDSDSDFDMYVAPRKLSIIDGDNHTHVLSEVIGNQSTKITSDEAEPPFNTTNDEDTEPEGPCDMGNALYVTQDEILAESLVLEPRQLQCARRPVLAPEDTADWIPDSLLSIVGTDSSISTPEERFEEEILWRAYLRYGFAPQGASRKYTPLRNDKQERDLMQVLGFRWYDDHANAFHREGISRFSHFVDYLSKKGIPSDLEWDLGNSHINSVALLPRFSKMRVVTVKPGEAKLYMFGRDSESSIKWNLAVTTPAHALMVCRLDAKWDISHVARYLVWNGIPFRTLQRSDSVQRAPFIDGTPLPRLPIRLTGYKFTAEDYKSYRDRCDQILQTHRGRVALMMGGHLWRLAVNIVSFDDTLLGPSGWYLDSSKMLVATDPRSGEEFIDDQFTESEIECLCGLNYYLTGNGEQQAKLTWYPLPKTLQYSGQDYGCWTELSEALFSVTSRNRDRAVDQLDDGENTVLDRQPVPVGKWRDLVRGSGTLRRLNLSYNSKADKFILDNGSY